MFEKSCVKLLVIVIISSSLVTLAALAVTTYFLHKIIYLETAFVDNCASSPCAKGHCESHDDFFRCNCLEGYTGQRCQTAMNNCASTPCFNGSSCINGINSFTCKCAAGKTGIQCEQDMVPCNSSPCQNGGTCVNQNIFAYQCTCRIGFLGQRCESTACTNYTEIKDIWRTLNKRDDSYHCDKDLISQGWYRFFVGGSNARMLLQAPSSSCGTTYSIWFKGFLPTIAGQLTNGVGCAAYNNHICYPLYSVPSISVRNCSGYYVFLLQSPPFCNAAYCTEPVK